MLVIRLVLTGVVAMATATTLAAWQRQSVVDGLTGYVLGPDGLPVRGGTVVVEAPLKGQTATIDRTGRFQVLPSSTGRHDVWIIVAGTAPHRLTVDVPVSRTLRLPVIRLAPATFFRARFVTASGEPITAPRLRHQSVDLSGVSITLPVDTRSERVDGDGGITLGPLPPGISMLVLDNPPLALTRLPDVQVTGAEQLIEGGTVVIQPGAVLHVEVTESSGAAVGGHDVFLEDVAPPGLSPLPVRRATTDALGRATFDRLAAGRYRLRTMTARRCGFRPLAIARFVSVSGNGVLKTQLVIGGTAIFRVRSPLGAFPGIAVSLTPDVAEVAEPAWLRPSLDVWRTFPRFPLNVSTPCTATTDAEGVVTLESVPPGPARFELRLPNSRYSRVVSVPDVPREIVVTVPDGLLSVRVISAVKSTPVAGATVVWTGGGARVDARTTGTGDALLEAVAASPGTLAIEAQGFERLEMKLAEPLSQFHEITLRPTPPTRLTVRVLADSGAAPDAVLELASENAMQPRLVAAAVKGSVMLLQVASGGLLLTASAERFVMAAHRVPHERGEELVMRLARGYRVIADVEDGGAQVVRVLNERGEDLDHILDATSDRVVHAPGRVSLGPLPSGTYTLELHGGGERRQRPVQLIDGDVHVTVR